MPSSVTVTARSLWHLPQSSCASTRGVCACIRRVAGCATPTGSAGHAGATANLKLTFHPDHSAGADHNQVRLAPAYKRGEPLVVVGAASAGARAAQSRAAEAPER
jgi:hypothetical protein